MRDSLPVLRKELLEIAMRRRTYIVRVAFAVVLFALFLVMYWQVVARGNSAGFGRGARLFGEITEIQLVAVLALTPALLAGAISQERERGSIELLFVTSLRPSEILLQKLIGRLLPVLSFLFLTLPLLAVAYALGGVSPHAILATGCVLVSACLQVGCVALFTSSLCQTTASSFILSYLVCGALFLGPPIVRMLIHISRARYADLSALNPIFVYENETYSIAGALSASIPLLAFAAIAFLGARVSLRNVRKPRYLLPKLWRKIDRMLRELNEEIGGVEILKDGAQLPDERPVAWREMHRSVLGPLRHRLRLLLFIEVPVILLWFFGVRSNATDSLRTIMVILLWGVAILTVTVMGANLIASERTHQTLDVLLTFPLSGREIVRQKAQVVNRLMPILMLPLLTVFVLASLVNRTYWGQLPPREYFVSSAVLLPVYIPLFSWLSIWIGLRTRSRGRAIIIAMTTTVGWFVVPFFLVLIIAHAAGIRSEYVGPCLLASPFTMIMVTESRGAMAAFYPNSAPAIIGNAACYGLLFLLFRGLCLAFADSCFGRPEQLDDEEELEAPVLQRRGEAPA